MSEVSESPDYDMPVPVDKYGHPRPQATEKRKPRRGSDPACPKVIAARVQRIALIMASGEWVSHLTPFALASEWGLSMATVRVYACEAGRLISRSIQENAELKARLVVTLETAIAGAAQQKKWRDVIEGVKAIAGLRGLDETIHKGGTVLAAVGLDELLAARAREAATANTAERPTSTDGSADQG